MTWLVGLLCLLHSCALASMQAIVQTFSVQTFISCLHDGSLTHQQAIDQYYMRRNLMSKAYSSLTNWFGAIIALTLLTLIIFVFELIVSTESGAITFQSTIFRVIYILITCVPPLIPVLLSTVPTNLLTLALTDRQVRLKDGSASEVNNLLLVLDRDLQHGTFAIQFAGFSVTQEKLTRVAYLIGLVLFYEIQLLVDVYA